jgi:hypothetical protein
MMLTWAFLKRPKIDHLVTKVGGYNALAGALPRRARLWGVQQTAKLHSLLWIGFGGDGVVMSTTSSLSDFGHVSDKNKGFFIGLFFHG